LKKTLPHQRNIDEVIQKDHIEALGGSDVEAGASHGSEASRDGRHRKSEEDTRSGHGDGARPGSGGDGGCGHLEQPAEAAGGSGPGSEGRRGSPRRPGRQSGGRQAASGPVRQMKLQWSERALQDLEGLLGYIEQDNPAAAQRLYAKLIEKTDHLLDFPNMGRVSPEAEEPFRELHIKPLRIVYLPEEQSVTIIAVFREEALLRL